MTNKERVIASIRFQPVDRIPYTVFLTSQAAESLIKYTGNPDYLKTLGESITARYLAKPMTRIKPDYDMDEFSVIWNKSGADKDIGVIDNIQIETEEDFDRYRFPEVDEEYVRTNMAWLEACQDDTFKVAGLGFSLFERAWTLMGMENLLCNMLVEPELVHRVLQKICDYNLRILDIALEYKFDCFHFGDDWGQQKGLIMGAPHWRTFIKPYLSQMYNRVRQAGRFVSQHSCGDIREILGDLHEMGLNIYQTFQPEIYGLDYAKELKGKIAVWGGISTQADLPFRKPSEMKALAEKTVEAFGGTGLILSPTHSIEFDVPPENIVALVEAFRGMTFKVE